MSLYEIGLFVETDSIGTRTYEMREPMEKSIFFNKQVHLNYIQFQFKVFFKLITARAGVHDTTSSTHDSRMVHQCSVRYVRWPSKSVRKIIKSLHFVSDSDCEISKLTRSKALKGIRFANVCEQS